MIVGKCWVFKVHAIEWLGRFSWMECPCWFTSTWYSWPSVGGGRRVRTKLELWSCGSQVFTSKAGPGGQALWCLCRIPAGDKLFSLSHMVKWWVLDLGEEWGKTTTKAEFPSGVGVNGVALKGSWPLRCGGEGAGPGARWREEKPVVRGQLLFYVEWSDPALSLPFSPSALTFLCWRLVTSFVGWL